VTDYRGLGFDPAPGSAEAVTSAGERWTGAAADIVIPGVPAESWAGEAANAFTAKLDSTRAELAATRDVLRAGAAILDTWAGEILANQRRAEQLDRRALALRKAVRAASDDVENATTTAQFVTGPAAVDAEADLASAVRRHEDLNRELERVLREARTLESDHLAAARRVAERLRALAEGGVESAARVPGRAESFGGIVTKLNSFSELGRGLASALLPTPRPDTPAAGAAFAFASALSRPPGEE
jgi:hypothetical protein